MNTIKILSPGKKLLDIRKKLKIKQSDITGGEIDRSLISLIENDKASLTPQVAKILTDNINAICTDKNIAFCVQANYLLEDENVQASRAADEFISYLKKSKEALPEDFEFHLETIVLFLLKYKVDEKESEIYELIGDIFDKSKDYDKSFTFYLKAYENSLNFFDNVQIFKILFKLSVCCIQLNKYNQAVIFHKLALKNTDNVPENILFSLLFNDAYINKKLNNYDKVLEQIEYMENNFTLDNLDKFDVFTIKANCLKSKNEYAKALDIHESLFLLVDEEHLERKLIILCNITEIYTLLNDMENTTQCLKVSLQLLEKYHALEYKPYSPNIYNEIGKGFSFVNDTDTAKDYFIKAFRASKEYKSNDMMLDSFNNLFEIIKADDNTIQMNNFMLMFLETMALGLVADPHIYILKFIKYYNNLKDFESVENLLKYYYKFNK